MIPFPFERRVRLVADVLEGVLVDAQIQEEDPDGEWQVTLEVTCARTLEAAIFALAALEACCEGCGHIAGGPDCLCDGALDP